jgi:tRNA threonylcarbamoyladenosine modification (KEOPS) complex  Pcc1 subunit
MIARFTFNFDSDEEANIVAKSIQPEIDHKIPKTKINTKINNKSFSLEIASKDVSSLRAACNSYLRWINTAVKVQKNALVNHKSDSKI